MAPHKTPNPRLLSDLELDLFYLIEGTDKPSYVSVPYTADDRPTKVNILRQSIFECSCKFLAPTATSSSSFDSNNLTLFKVNIDRNHPEIRLPLLRHNPTKTSLIPLSKYDEGVEEIAPWQKIHEIWPEQPTSDRIHIFVTFTHLPGGLVSRMGILEAAHLVYYQFWGRNFNEVLHPVPDHGDFKYITEQQIDSLSLRESLLYDEDVLLVREEYKVAYRELKLYEENHQVERVSGVIVTGQRGIGKTVFLYYLLFRLLSEEKTVAFQVNGNFILFQDSGIQMVESTYHGAYLIPCGTWALSNSQASSVKPCQAFLYASMAGDAWVVQTTPPSPTGWAKWPKERTAVQYWMDVFPLDELTILGTILHLDLKQLHNNYDLWGPSAQICMMKPKQLIDHQLAVASTAYQFVKNSSEEDRDAVLASDRLFAVQPTKESRQDIIARFATAHLLGFVSRAYAKHEHAIRRRFYKAISGHAWFGASAGHIFRTHVLLWFRYAPAQDCLPCTRAVPVGGRPVLEIPVCGKNMEYFYEVDDLKDADEYESPTCLVPVSQNLPSFDAIVLTDKFVITVQMTVTSKLDAFEKVYQYLPSTLTAKRQRCHVFLTDSEDKADLLRGQELTNLPKAPRTKILVLVYSAFINIGQWDSILTPDRVEELENDMQRASQRKQSQVMDTTE